MESVGIDNMTFTVHFAKGCAMLLGNILQHVFDCNLGLAVKSVGHALSQSFIGDTGRGNESFE